MEKSLINKLALGIFFLVAVSPFMGYVTYTVLGKDESPFLLLMCLPVIYLLLFERGTLIIPSYIFYFFLFTTYTIISDRFIVGEGMGLSYIRNNDLLGSLLFVIVLESVFIPKKFYETVFKISYYILIFAFIVSVMQEVYKFTFFVNPHFDVVFENWSEMEARLPSIYTWVGPLAEIGLAFFPIMGVVAEDMLLKKQTRQLTFLFFIGFIVAFLNKSRYVILNYLIAFVLIPIHKGINFKQVSKYVAIVVVAVFLIFMGAKSVGFDVDDYINNRMLNKNKGGLAHGSASTRILAFHIFGKLFPENPILGKGKFHRFGKGENASRDIELMRMLHKRSSQIHVGYLSLFYYYGLIGGILYVLFLISLTRKLHKDAKRTGRFSPLIGWYMFLVSNLTTVYLAINIMGIVMCLFFNKYYVDNLEVKDEVDKS